MVNVTLDIQFILFSWLTVPCYPLSFASPIITFVLNFIKFDNIESMGMNL